MASLLPCMSYENDSDDGEDGDDSPRTYREHKLAKNPRTKDPDEAGPRDPAAEMHEEHGTGSGFEDVLEGDGDVSKSTQEELEDALTDADFLGVDPVAKGNNDQVDLSWSREDFEDDPTEADLLAEIRDELAQMNAADRERALKSLTRDSTHGTTDGVSAAADAVATLERIEDALAAEEQAEMLEDALNAYVEASPENGLEDPLGDVVAWLREQAEDMDPEERGRLMDTLDRLETAAEGDGAGAAA